MWYFRTAIGNNWIAVNKSIVLCHIVLPDQNLENAMFLAASLSNPLRYLLWFPLIRLVQNQFFNPLEDRKHLFVYVQLCPKAQAEMVYLILQRK